MNKYENKKLYTKTQPMCKNCGCELEYKKRTNTFCSRSCSTSYNNRGVCRVQKNPDRRCEYCKNIIPSTERRRKYCSSECFNNHAIIKNEERIKLGKCNEPKTLKTYLFNTRGEICSICGQGNIWNNKHLVLQLDHIDGNGFNNSLSNLRILCGHCHSQTHTYASRNVKNIKMNNYVSRYKSIRKK